MISEEHSKQKLSKKSKPSGSFVQYLKGFTVKNQVLFSIDNKNYQMIKVYFIQTVSHHIPSLSTIIINAENNTACRHIENKSKERNKKPRETLQQEQSFVIIFYSDKISSISNYLDT